MGSEMSRCPGWSRSYVMMWDSTLGLFLPPKSVKLHFLLLQMWWILKQASTNQRKRQAISFSRMIFFPKFIILYSSQTPLKKNSHTHSGIKINKHHEGLWNLRKKCLYPHITKGWLKSSLYCLLFFTAQDNFSGESLLLLFF